MKNCSFERPQFNWIENYELVESATVNDKKSYLFVLKIH